MIQIIDKTKCSGCTACYSVCPNNCIAMKSDTEGFLYPSVNTEACIECHRCEDVCPITGREIPGYDSVKIFGCQNKNEAVRKISTSGGAFGALAAEIIKRGGFVWAAGFDENMTVCHKKAENTEELTKMYGSKYVQSNLRDTFKEIKYALSHTDLPVLFVGTPCQVEGLVHSVTTKEREKLYTADLICYGVPSPGLYTKWLEAIEKRHHSKVEKIYFRDKKYGYAGVNIKLMLADGKKLEDRLEVKTFVKSMFSHIGLRPSCYECPLRGRKKVCDFTLGDMWEIGQYSKELDDNLGTTSVRVYSKKGEKLLEDIKPSLRICKVTELAGEDLIEKLQNEKFSFEIPEKRKAFFEDAKQISYNELIKKYLPTKPKEVLAIWLKPVIVKLPLSEVFFRTLKKFKIIRSLKKH